MEMETGSDSGAQFLGWQKTPWGGLVALYVVTSAKHPLYGSTVSEKTLRKNNFQIPHTPAPAAQSVDIDHEQ